MSDARGARDPPWRRPTGSHARGPGEGLVLSTPIRRRRCGERWIGHDRAVDLSLPRDAVRALDRRAAEEFGVPSIVLMENAGRACAEEALRLLAAAEEGAEAIVCAGPGNNGGDGFVVARTLANRGRAVRVFFLGGPGRLERGSHDALTNARAWHAMGGTTVFLAPDAEGSGAAGSAPRGREAERGVAGADVLREALRSSALAVDALFGTGLTRPLEGLARTVVEALAEAPRVLAVDVPSGLDADEGRVLGAAVRADVTVSFVGRKPGLERGLGPRLAGRVVVAEIGIPRPLLLEAGGGPPAAARPWPPG